MFGLTEWFPARHGGALRRNVTPKNAKFYVLTDFSPPPPYILMPSSFHIKLKWNSIGLANGVISYHFFTLPEALENYPF